MIVKPGNVITGLTEIFNSVDCHTGLHTIIVVGELWTVGTLEVKSASCTRTYACVHMYQSKLDEEF